jgi:hypothetical protein
MALRGMGEGFEFPRNSVAADIVGFQALTPFMLPVKGALIHCGAPVLNFIKWKFPAARQIGNTLERKENRLRYEVHHFRV